MISDDDLEVLQKALPTMSEKERQRNLVLLKDYQKEMTQKNGKANFLEFIKHVYPGYKVGAASCDGWLRLFEDIAARKEENELLLTLHRDTGKVRAYFISCACMVPR
jgi:hypothetical protein